MVGKIRSAALKELSAIRRSEAAAPNRIFILLSIPTTNFDAA